MTPFIQLVIIMKFRSNVSNGDHVERIECRDSASQAWNAVNGAVNPGHVSFTLRIPMLRLTDES